MEPFLSKNKNANGANPKYVATVKTPGVIVSIFIRFILFYNNHIK
jgi:hypothetical protein